jgi:predicted amidohydrolase
MKKTICVSLIMGTLIALFLTGCSNKAVALTAFTDVNVVPITSERIVENQTVLVEGARIVAIGDSNTLLVPEATQVIDGNGAYLMPGLADMHMHTWQDWEDRDIWPVHPLNLYLANGVTTIRDSPWTNHIRLRETALC